MLERTLPGTWVLVRTGTGSGTDAAKPFEVSYRLISNSSALVETWGVNSARETESVFHPDHTRVLLTHYCAQGNQPRLRATDVGDDAIVFRFVDVTNREPSQDMLVERTLHLARSSLEIVEVYRTARGADERTVYRFVRRE